MSLISVKGLAKRYGERDALRDVCFDVRPASSSRSSDPTARARRRCLSILAGVQRASAGTIGGPGSGSAIGWAPQQTALYSKLSVVENLRLFARLERVADPDARSRGCSSRPA